MKLRIPILLIALGVLLAPGVLSAQAGKIKAEVKPVTPGVGRPVTRLPTLKLLAPNDGNAWYRGVTHEVKWEPGMLNQNVRIVLRKTDGNGGIFEITPSIPASAGHVSYTVPSNFGWIGNSHRVSIYALDGTLLAESVPFSIVDPKIEVTGPVLEEHWEAGRYGIIKWQAYGVTQNVKIVLQRVGGEGTLVTPSTAPGDPFGRQFNFLVPNNLEGPAFKIIITTLDGKLRGETAWTFKINGYVPR